MRTAFVWMITVSVLFSAGLLPAQDAAAGQKFAWVDLEKVFKAYKKTGPALAEVEKEIDQKEEELKKLVEEINQLEGQLSLMGEETRSQKAQELQEKKLAAARIREESEMELSRKLVVVKGKLLADILEVVEEIGKKEGYTFIFRGEVPELVLYKDPAIDITDRVIEKVNIGLIDQE